MASIIAAEPAALSVAPVPACLPEGTLVFGVDAVQPPPAQAIRRPRGSLVHARRIGQPRAVAVGQIPERVHDLGALQPFGLDTHDRLQIHGLGGLGPGLRDESDDDDQRGQRRPHNRSGHGTSSWKAAV